MKPSKKNPEGKSWRRAGWEAPEEPSLQRVAERVPGRGGAFSQGLLTALRPPLPSCPALALDKYVLKKNEGVRAWQNSHHLLPQSGRAMHQAEAPKGSY